MYGLKQKTNKIESSSQVQDFKDFDKSNVFVLKLFNYLNPVTSDNSENDCFGTPPEVGSEHSQIGSSKNGCLFHPCWGMDQMVVQ